MAANKLIESVHMHLGTCVPFLDFQFWIKQPGKLQNLIYSNGVIVIKDCPWNKDEFLTEIEGFGVFLHLRVNDKISDSPVSILSNEKSNLNEKHYDKLGYGWHSDFCHLKAPASYTFLHGKIIPGEGGDTIFTDMIGAYDGLNLQTRQRLATITVRHSIPGKLGSDNGGEGEFVDHPLVRSIPGVDKPALYIGSKGTASPLGMPKSDGDELISRLIAFSVQSKFTYKHEWSVNDLLIWDNRSTMHTATDFDRGKFIRRMHRISFQGEAPTPFDKDFVYKAN